MTDIPDEPQIIETNSLHKGSINKNRNTTNYFPHILIASIVAILTLGWYINYIYHSQSPKSQAAGLVGLNSNNGRQNLQGTQQALNSELVLNDTETSDIYGEIYLADAGLEMDPKHNTAWQSTSTNFGPNLCSLSTCGIGHGTAGPRTGNNWNWFGGIGITENATMSQTINIPDNTYQLHFYLWIGQHRNTSTDNYLRLLLNNDEVWRVNDRNSEYYSGYKLVNIPLANFRGSVQLKFDYHNDNIPEIVTMNVDDIFLSKTNNQICQTPFQDLSMSYSLYPYLQYAGCQNAIESYACGSTNEPCIPGNARYIRPVSNPSRAMFSKSISQMKGYSENFQNRSFADVFSNNPYFVYVERIHLHHLVDGYACGGPNEPCDSQNRPYFRLGTSITRSQVAKMVSIAANYTETPSHQTFTDVLPGNSSYLYIERLALHNVVNGYACGGLNEPCDSQQRPYFRPNLNVSNQQAAKMITVPFHP